MANIRSTSRIEGACLLLSYLKSLNILLMRTATQGRRPLSDHTRPLRSHTLPRRWLERQRGPGASLLLETRGVSDETCESDGLGIKSALYKEFYLEFGV